jgi:Polyketide cyclase / dehydrase and lipid transport
MPVHVEEDLYVERSAAEVWESIADYGFDQRWRTGLIEMTPDPPGPAAVGTKVHEVVRSSGRDFVADTVVTELEPGVAYRFAGEGTIGGVAGGRRVASAGEGRGSTSTYEIDLDPKGAMRLLRPVLGPMVRSGLRKDLRKLKALLEMPPDRAT